MSYMGSTTRRGMQRRHWVVIGVLSAVGGIALSAGGISSCLWDRSPSDVVARGVTVGGIALGGLSSARAHDVLAARLTERLRRPVELVRGDRRFTVRPTNAGLTVDVDRMVDAALAASRSGG